ncbi:MAG TPA: glycosyltransferase [Stellaceae bacterium]|nr:glycosyltransferase [Stellaceae bacterium]
MPAEIPKILHQTWRNSDLPGKFARWRAAWRGLHPDWEHRFYDDADIRRLVTDRAPQMLSVFEALPRPILRVDLFRYLIVHLDGGVYADLDMKPYRASDPLLAGSSCVLSVEAHVGPTYQKVVGYPQPWQLANCIFAAVPGHPFFAELLERIAIGATAPVHSDDDVEEITGPRVLTRLIYDLPAARRGAVRVLPQIHWMAPWMYPRVGALATQIHARHASTGTWRFGTRWSRKTIRNRLIARARCPNPFIAEGPVLP